MMNHDRVYSYEKILPAASLAAFVKFFYYFHGRGSQLERILPLSLAEITFNLGTNGVKSYIVPPGNQSYIVVPSTLDRIIGICFHPWGLHALLKLPPGQLGGMKNPLADALRIPGAEMTERLLKGNSPREMISKLEAYLVSRIGNDRDQLIRDAISFIDLRHGQVDLTEFYQCYAQSARRLQMIFQQSIGMSPKKYCRLKRFHYAVKKLTAARGLTSLALESGYYDQPHFIHEFRAFSGTHPMNYLKESNQLNAINAESWF
jgi:AraC-like DNA-binding protein